MTTYWLRSSHEDKNKPKVNFISEMHTALKGDDVHSTDCI